MDMDEIKGEFKIWNGTCVQANVLVSWRQADTQTNVAIAPTNLAFRPGVYARHAIQLLRCRAITVV